MPKTIASMTAFACKTQETRWGLLTWEIRSVNHRYLEISLRVPDFLRDLEKNIRDQMQSYLSRGKIEAILRFQPGEEVPVDVVVNQILIKQLAEATKNVMQYFPQAQVDAMSILSWPGILQTKEVNVDAINKMILDLLEETLQELLACRQREGNSMLHYLQERLATVKQQLQLIQQQQPIILAASRQKILARLEEITTNLDKDRLEQEMVWLTQKADIAEELQRAEAHLTEVVRVLKQGGVVGRRLDFLMQELNREANTLGSKSMDAESTQAVVEIKVQIEQMREQVQNIE